MSAFLILGAGGHAKVVADILQASGERVIGFLDDRPERIGTVWFGYPVLGPLDSHADHAADALILAIGDNQARHRAWTRLAGVNDVRWGNAIHPSAVIARSVRLGRGLVIAAGAVVNPDAALGDHTILNTGATVDHDCVIQPFAHVGPGVHLAGGVTVGVGALLGIGSSVIPGRTIGDWAVVGAGAAVIDDLPLGCVAAGVPATVRQRG